MLVEDPIQPQFCTDILTENNRKLVFVRLGNEDGLDGQEGVDLRI